MIEFYSAANHANNTTNLPAGGDGGGGCGAGGGGGGALEKMVQDSDGRPEAAAAAVAAAGLGGGGAGPGLGLGLGLGVGLTVSSGGMVGGVGAGGGGGGGAGGGSERASDVCEGCGQKIHDRFLMRVSDSSWHEHCLACSECGVLLSNSCYCRNAKLYCKVDYDRKFGVKCSRCDVRLLAHELVMRAQSLVFHLQCFECVECRQQLQKGDQFVVRAGKLFCRPDFEKKLFMLQPSPAGDDLLDENSRPRDGRRGPKRPRTILTSAQRRQFKASFEISPKPCRKVREALAKETGLSVRVVQVWFQNQRAKMKKLQRKAKQEADQKTGDKDKDAKDDKGIKQEPTQADHTHFLPLGGLAMRDGAEPAFAASASQPLNPNVPFSPDEPYPAHSGDSFCSSDISLDDSTNFEQLDEGGSDSLSLQNLDLPPQAPHGDGLLPGLVQVNPIDKLYLMQNSYFSTEQ